jgi:hypothetical protein
VIGVAPGDAAVSSKAGSAVGPLVTVGSSR